MTDPRSLLRGFLAVVLLLTSVGMGVARGQAQVVDHVLLCGSFGTKMVAVDARGNTVQAPGHCPDCACLLLGPLVDEPHVVVSRMGLALDGEALPWEALPLTQRAGLRPPARAPPGVWTA